MRNILIILIILFILATAAVYAYCADSLHITFPNGGETLIAG